MNTTTTDLLEDKINAATAARVNAVLNEAMLPLLALPSMKDLGSTIQEFRTRLTRILTPGVREKVVDEMLRALEPAPYSRPVAEDNLWDSVPPPASFTTLDNLPRIPASPDRTLRFFADGKEVGVFDLGASPMTFTGDVDASARSFVDNVLEMMGDASTRSKDEEIEKLQMQLAACAGAAAQTNLDCLAKDKRFAYGHLHWSGAYAAVCAAKDREEAHLAEIEKLQMQIAACGVAALCNTRSTIKDQRINGTNPYWSASYHDVCGAVDREMNYREALQRIAELGESPAAKNIAMVVLMHPLADLPPIPVQP